MVRWWHCSCRTNKGVGISIHCIEVSNTVIKPWLKPYVYVTNLFYWALCVCMTSPMYTTHKKWLCHTYLPVTSLVTRKRGIRPLYSVKLVLLCQFPNVLGCVHKFIQLSQLLCRHLLNNSFRIYFKECLTWELTLSKVVGSNFFPLNLFASPSCGNSSRYSFHCDRNPMTCAGFVTSLCRRNSMIT